MSLIRKMSSLMLVTVSLAYVTVSNAQNNSPVDVIRTRQQGMKDLGASFKTVRDQLKQSSPDMAAIKAAGDNIKKTADLISAWFPKGTGVEAGIKTGAKPEIWSDAATFDKKLTDFVAAAGPFAKLTASGNASAIIAGIRPFSSTCKGCHDMFFNDEH